MIRPVTLFRLSRLPVLGLLFALGHGAAAQADEVHDRLNRFYAEVKTMQAEFQQRVFDSAGGQMQEARGTFSLQRPGRFRWDYREPYTQLVLADGERLWMYDADLEQVTVKKMQGGLSATPAWLLSGSRPLDEEFTIRSLPERDGLSWVELQPRQASESFDQVRLGFDASHLRALEMVDGLGQTTRLDFSRLSINPKLAPALFTFTPPPGVDVVGDDH
ncbi:MAG: outer membrane lipoprotein carrier protein LolA [Gammaproteobacteria bacterium RBG_16_57_12]|nr:MAG: outer membrane lipoprotein carrier protein LolA [Gammaproteobacteria bacterium RBG_16_57_12]